MGMQQLEIDKFPLTGRRLIEASAGTGKTYTITGLYLRLLLEVSLTVREILVVTFTEAATQELRGRIRERIREALQHLEGRTRYESLAGLLAPYESDKEVIQRLRDALTCMDEAAIYTIHGFCQRVLTDSAFESGALFEAEFITQETELRLQLARDFWRYRFKDASYEYAEWILSNWSGPADLLKSVALLLDHAEAHIEPLVDSDQIDELAGQLVDIKDEMLAIWSREHEVICGLLRDKKRLSQAKNNYKPDNLEPAIIALEDWLKSEPVPMFLSPGIELFTKNKLNDPKSLLRNSTAPEHVFFSRAQQLVDTWTKVETYRRSQVMIEASRYIRSALEKRKSEERILFFDDLLTRLDRALSGPAQDFLASRIRSQYPMAMIDEFQDTDPLQYRIFDRIYEGAPESGLFMIGDPKQAIYSFRGADIFTYMQARHDTDPALAHFTLGKNWRSHSRLVGAINSLFSGGRCPFIYDEDIGFYPVEAAGKADAGPLLINGVEVEPLVAWFVPRDKDNASKGLISKTWAMPNIARGVAAEIAELLNLGIDQKAVIDGRNLVASDIAVLVRNRYEAAHVKQALAARGIASVYISRDSVFETEEARELTYLLHAVHEPRNAVRMRTALATRLMGWDAGRLHSLSQDERVWENRIMAFQAYHDLWRTDGFMSMFLMLIREEQLVGNLLAQADGERRLTNLLQLAELIDAASHRHPGMEDVLRWLLDERLNPNGDNEEQQLRLESDESLVQIVTVHKSKGLEYPIVFLPYIWGSRSIDDDGPIAFHDETDRHLYLDIGTEERSHHIRLADQERLAEDLRLLYVALTRAKHRCYFSWGQFYGASASGMAWLLHQELNEATGDVSCRMAGMSDEALEADLAVLNRDKALSIKISGLPGYAGNFEYKVSGRAPVTPLVFRRKLDLSWRATSFTGLTRSIKSGTEHFIDLPDYDAGDTGKDQPVSVQAHDNRFSFHRGAKAGEFLHAILEQLDFATSDEESMRQLVTRELQHYGFDLKWLDVLLDWIQDILDTPLDPSGSIRLRGIAGQQCLKEMAFHFPLEGLTSESMNDLLSVSGKMTGAKLGFQSLKGMMKGFIDLVFEEDGRFYVLDYKSNHLGDSEQDYGHEHMAHAMQEHHYHLQYLIYVVALHRYLQQRLDGYEYERDFGGVYYLFLRGMNPARGDSSGVFHTRPALELIEALDNLFATDHIGEAHVD